MIPITKDNLKEALILLKNNGTCTKFLTCEKCPWNDGCKEGHYTHLQKEELQEMLLKELNKFSIEEIVEVLL